MAQTSRYGQERARLRGGVRAAFLMGGLITAITKHDSSSCVSHWEAGAILPSPVVQGSPLDLEVDVSNAGCVRNFGTLGDMH